MGWPGAWRGGWLARQKGRCGPAPAVGLLRAARARGCGSCGAGATWRVSVPRGSTFHPALVRVLAMARASFSRGARPVVQGAATSICSQPVRQETRRGGVAGDGDRGGGLGPGEPGGPQQAGDAGGGRGVGWQGVDGSVAHTDGAGPRVRAEGCLFGGGVPGVAQCGDGLRGQGAAWWAGGPLWLDGGGPAPGRECPGAGPGAGGYRARPLQSSRGSVFSAVASKSGSPLPW